MNSSLRTFRNTNVLVTGGMGFIGSNLVAALLRQGARVTIVDPCISGCGGDPRNLGEDIHQVEWLPFDIGHTSVIEEAIRSAQVIFNLAGEIRHQHSMVDPLRDLTINTRSQLLFLQRCAQLNPGVRIVYAGTRQVYGSPRYLPVDEDHPVAPLDFNGVHKQAAASYHQLLSRQGLLDACVLHLSNVDGPRMALDVPGQGFLMTFARCLRDGRTIEVFGSGKQLRDPLYVDDAIEAFLLAGSTARLPSRTYNLGGPGTLSLWEIATLATELAGAPPPRLRPFPEEHLQIDIGDYATDCSRIGMELGWRPRINFDEGMRRTLECLNITTATVMTAS